MEKREEKRQKLSHHSETENKNELNNDNEAQVFLNKIPPIIMQKIFSLNTVADAKAAQLVSRKWQGLGDELKNNHNKCIVLNGLMEEGSLTNIHKFIIENKPFIPELYLTGGAAGPKRSVLHKLASLIPATEAEESLFQEIFHCLIQLGADINAVCENISPDSTDDEDRSLQYCQNSVLAEALTKNNLFYFNLLLQNNAQIVFDPNGIQWLHLLAEILPKNKYEEDLFRMIFAKLINAGADINAVYSYAKSQQQQNLTVIMKAISNRNNFYFDLLLEYKADINFDDGNEENPLHGSVLGWAHLCVDGQDLYNGKNAKDYFFDTLLKQPNLSVKKGLLIALMEYHGWGERVAEKLAVSHSQLLVDNKQLSLQLSGLKKDYSELLLAYNNLKEEFIHKFEGTGP